MAEKVLIVDDDGSTIKLLEDRLKSHSYEVVSSSNGREALEKAKLEQPGLIISDVIMPEMDGFSFLKELKKDPLTAQIPIVILSARVAMEDTFRVFEVDEFMTKPIDMEQLLDVVKAKIGTVAAAPDVLKEKAPPAENAPASDHSSSEPSPEAPEEPEEEKEEPKKEKPEEVVQEPKKEEKKEEKKQEPVAQEVPQAKKIKEDGKAKLGHVQPDEEEKGNANIIIAASRKLVKGLSTKLRNKNYIVKTVGKQEELQPMISEFLPDLVIMDVFLENKKADQMVRDIRREKKLRKISIILFEHVDKDALDAPLPQRKMELQEAKNACVDAGATQAIGAFDEEQLLAAVKLCLGL